MPKYFINPFAYDGDKETIPETPQVNGMVSYPTGYTEKYEEEFPDDPDALPVERDKQNELFFDITDNIKYWQQNNYPLYTDPSQNLGNPVIYGKHATVNYNNELYQSLIANNNTVPGSNSSWYHLIPKMFDTDYLCSVTNSLTFAFGGTANLPLNEVETDKKNWFIPTNNSIKPGISGWYLISILLHSDDPNTNSYKAGIGYNVLVGSEIGRTLQDNSFTPSTIQGMTIAHLSASSVICFTGYYINKPVSPRRCTGQVLLLQRD